MRLCFLEWEFILSRFVMWNGTPLDDCVCKSFVLIIITHNGYVVVLIWSIL
jgi:hypothetical protein